jgi:hypothetical protein
MLLLADSNPFALCRSATGTASCASPVDSGRKKALAAPLPTYSRTIAQSAEACWSGSAQRTLRAQPHQIAGDHEALERQSVSPGTAEQHKHDQQDSPTSEHQGYVQLSAQNGRPTLARRPGSRRSITARDDESHVGRWHKKTKRSKCEHWNCGH